MSLPTQSIFPIENGKLTTVLDCNNLQLINLDESNLSGGGGGSGNDTGTTTALLKGDGNHGFADAIAGTDYATPGAVDLKEDTATHDADILVLTTAVDLTEADIVTLTTAVGTKASSAALTAGLALKADDADLQAYITSNDADVALKAYITDVDDALAFKADASGVTTSLSLKEDLLPTTSFDGYILSRNIDGSWHLVDPVTLGTTSQTFTDGQSFTNTNYDSATAAFVAGDVGKTITCAGVIPDDTTIVSRTSATRVVLSAPTLSTSTGETFTIINRLLVNNTGTVTSVSFTNNVTNLLNATSGISNPTSSPTLTLNPATVAANSFYGNFTNFAGFATFGAASVARASLGGTTVGQALFQLANPSAISFLRVNADNTVTARSATNFLGDIGAENALTFSSPPFVRTINAISIPAANGLTLTSGYLTSTDWNTFNGKLGTGRTITTTAPIRIDGLSSANLTVDRTLSMAASSGNPDGTSPVDGYLRGTDFISFTNKVPNSRTIGTALGTPLSVTNLGKLDANITLSIAKATASADGYLASGDFSAFANQVPVIRQAGAGGTLTLADVSPPITRVILNSVLTSPLTINMPQSIGYGFNIGFPFIEIVDITPTGAQTIANRVTISRTGTADTIDAATSVLLPMGAAYTRINSNGLNRWITAKYFAEAFKDATDSSKRVNVSFSNWLTTGVSRTLRFAPDDDSVTVIPGGAIGEVLRSIDGDGNVTHSAVSASEVVPNEETVLGTIDKTLSNSGSTTSVKLITDLTATRTYTFPDANLYAAGEVVRFYDATGSITSSKFVRVQSDASYHAPFGGTTGNTFNGNPSIDLTDPFFSRAFSADPTNNNWTVSTGGGLSIDPWHAVTPSSGTATLALSSNVIENHHIVNMSGAITLVLSGSVPAGSTGRIKFRDSTGNHVVTVPNNIGQTPSPGVGTFTTSTGSTIEDEYGWDWDGQKYNFFPLGLNMLMAALPSFVTSDVDTTAFTTIGSQAQGSTDNFRYGIANRMLGNGGVTNGSSYIIGKVRLPVFKTVATSIAYSVYVDIHDNIAGGTGGLVGAKLGSTSSAVLASSLPTSEPANGSGTDFDCNTGQTIIGKRNVSSITTISGNTTITGAPGSFLQSDVGCIITGTGIAGSTIGTTIITSVGTDDGSFAQLSVACTAGGTVTVSVQHIYWIVYHGDNAATDASNFTSWPWRTLSGVPYHRSTLGTSWSLVGSSRQFKYITYR